MNSFAEKLTIKDLDVRVIVNWIINKVQLLTAVHHQYNHPVITKKDVIVNLVKKLDSECNNLKDVLPNVVNEGYLLDAEAINKRIGLLKWVLLILRRVNKDDIIIGYVKQNN